MRKRKQKLRLENRKKIDLNIINKSKSTFWNKLTGKPPANQRGKKKQRYETRNDKGEITTKEKNRNILFCRHHCK